MNPEYVVLHCETQKFFHQVNGGWDNIFDQGLSSAVTYSSRSKVYRFWTSDMKTKLCEYLNKKLVVSFNGICFDSKLLLGNERVLEPGGITGNNLYSWLNADLYVEIFRRIMSLDRTNYPLIISKIQEQTIPKGVFTLDAIIKATLNISRASGIQTPELFQTGKIVELFQYNLQDVRTIKQLYHFIQERKYIVTGNYDVVQFT